jgi:hypothetical protein
MQNVRGAGDQDASCISQHKMIFVICRKTSYVQSRSTTAGSGSDIASCNWKRVFHVVSAAPIRPSTKWTLPAKKLQLYDYTKRVLAI